MIRITRTVANGIVISANFQNHEVPSDFLRVEFPPNPDGKPVVVSMTDLIHLKHMYGHRNGISALAKVNRGVQTKYKTNMNPLELFSCLTIGTKAGGALLFKLDDVKKAFGDKFEEPFVSFKDDEEKTSTEPGEKFDRLAALPERSAARLIKQGEKPSK